MNKNEIKILLSSALENLSVIRTLIRTYLTLHKVEERNIMEILTITDELATNVVEHGYQYQPGELIITIEKEGSIIKLVVEDNGVGFDESKMSTVGLHASLAAKVVQAASKYAVDINLIYNDKVIDVKSILGLMSLAIPAGENVVIEANGDQAESAINDIATLLS